VPTIFGPGFVRAALLCSRGSWSGTPFPSFTYAWLRDGVGIAGATNQTYEVQGADEGHTLSCQVTASNVAGSATARSSGLFVATTPPLPVLRVSAIATAHSGTVLVRRKGSASFVPLTEARVPLGSELDATNGRVTPLFVVTNGTTQTAEVFGGRFFVAQSTSGAVTFTLSLPLTGCRKIKLPRGASTAHAYPRRGPKVRQLWVHDVSGSWATVGRFVTTSASSTTWMTLDECSRSLAKVTQGRVKVRDLVKRKTKSVTAGHSYIADARKTPH
jgi:hypothetical protein